MKISSRGSRLIMGSAIGLAAIAAAIDHTRHRLPEPVSARQAGEAADDAAVIIIEEGGSASPCSMDSPCALTESPCALDQQAPCSLEAPCALETAPCSL